jgi:prepilin-type N-terminal cleavage/methylation domain-containing protein
LKAGFSLIELLVVIALIALLIALILYLVGTVRDQARTLECQSNQHQLQVGLYGYSMEHSGRFISPRTSPLNDLPIDLLWVRSYNGEGEVRLNPNGTEKANALHDGALWDYVGDERVYSSPLDPTGRLRSYSLNGFISDLPDNDQNPEYSWGPVADRMSKVKSPANTLLSCPEDDHQPFNLHGFVIQVYADEWIDYPIDWFDPGKTTIGFADGSVTTLKYANPRLLDDIDGHWDPVSAETQLDWDEFERLIRTDE